MLSIPPHSSHRLQPLDRGLFGNLKQTYSQVCADHLTDCPGTIISQIDFCMLFGRAFSRYLHPKYAVGAFKECGIVPFNRNVLDDEDFLPSTVTDRGNNNEEEPIENVSENEDDPAKLERPIENEPVNISGVQEIEPAAEEVQTEPQVSNEPVNSSMQISVEEINPIPRMKKPRGQRSLRAGKSFFLTSTPEKTSLEKKIEEQKRKFEELEERKRVRKEKKRNAEEAKRKK